MDAFSQAGREGFEDFMVGDLRTRFPDACEPLSDDDLRDRIRNGIKRAGRYEIHEQRDVGCFIRLGFGMGPDFDKTPWASPILKETTVSGTERLSRIRKAADEERLPRRA